MARRNILMLVMMVFPIIAKAQSSTVRSTMYSWKDPDKKVKDGLFEAELFRGAAFDMEMLSMTANSLKKSANTTQMEVSSDEEHLILIKEGVMEVSIGDSTWALNAGSVALLMPGQVFSVRNDKSLVCTFYIMKYRSKESTNIERGKSSGGSSVRMWNNIPFKPHDRGGIRNYFERPTAMCKRFEMHVTTLKEGIKSHEPHTHRAEEIVLVINNKTEMQIGEQFYKGAHGDIYFLGSNVSHAIRNDGKGTCTYFAFQFE